MRSVVAVDSICVISPHLDDAVFSCGELLAQCAEGARASTVLTVLSGMPPADIGLTWYDGRCGFTSSMQAMHARFSEDDAALSVLRTDAVRMEALDSQYAALPSADDLAHDIHQALSAHAEGLDLCKDSSAHAAAGHDCVLMPLGLFHCDHERVADACLAVMRERDLPIRWMAYEDVLYRRRAGVLQARLAHLYQLGVIATPVSIAGPGVTRDPTQLGLLKRQAVACYASQLNELSMAAGGDETSAERYYHLSLR